MENANGGAGAGGAQTISCDDVISKLKDDGDFDRLRLKVIRKLKENEELRKSIVSIVKQSVALNRPGSETMKPRQLSDAIHEEVGAKVNEQISNGLWEIIRSTDPDSIKTEITETVKTVYNKLSRPNPEPVDHDPKRTRKANGELQEAPQTVSHEIGNGLPEEEQRIHQSKQVLEKVAVDLNSPPEKDEGDGSDEDPDAPPGFG
ncbi:hypothetical protein LXL04_026501 [Taraxacum kok-saghyz]